MNCTLCESQNTLLYLSDKTGEYHQCLNCDLVFQLPSSYLNAAKEKEHYGTHENDPSNEGYRKFLSRITSPLLEKITIGDVGLDYGCGPGPAISVILGEHGYKVDNYDLYFTTGFTPKLNTYDFITSTEVFEHLYRPGEVIKNILKLLKKDGYLGIMTVFRPDSLDEFKTWWYKKDPTHVCFYTPKTFEFLGNDLNCEVEFISNQVVFLRKK